MLLHITTKISSSAFSSLLYSHKLYHHYPATLLRTARRRMSTNPTTTMMMHAIQFDNPGDEFHLANVPRPTPQKVLPPSLSLILFISPPSHHCAWLHYAIITTHSPPFSTHTLHLLFTNTLYSPQLSRSPPSPILLIYFSSSSFFSLVLFSYVYREK